MSVWDELASPEQRAELLAIAHERRWGLACILTGWLHLLAFALCYYLTVARAYHAAPGYLAVWGGELLGMGLIFHRAARRRPAAAPLPPLARFIVRVWVAYFLLAFSLATMNALRGHALFELFPATASLASFGFLVLTFAVQRRFFAAVLVMFLAGQLMAAHLLHAYLIFAVAWCVVLNGLGLLLLAGPRVPQRAGRPVWPLYFARRPADVP